MPVRRACTPDRHPDCHPLQGGPGRRGWRGDRALGRRLLIAVLGSGPERRDQRRKPEHEGKEQQHAPDLHNLNLAYRFMDTRPIKEKGCKYR
jgi:hypothetical protein